MEAETKIAHSPFKMTDVFELINRYMPKDRSVAIAGGNAEYHWVSADLTQVAKVILWHAPEHGWMVSLDPIALVFKVEDKETGERLAKIFSTQVELCKGAPLEEQMTKINQFSDKLDEIHKNN